MKILTDNGIFYLCAKSEINLWFLLINELCSAIYLSNELKDDSLIQYAAKNIILVDSLVASALNEETIHHENIEKSANYLCYYSLLKDDSHRLLPVEVKEILHLRLNPSQREFNNSQSIESIIYVDIDDYPTVWCAIGNRINIYDAINWSDEATNLKTNDKIVPF